MSRHLDFGEGTYAQSPSQAVVTYLHQGHPRITCATLRIRPPHVVTVMGDPMSDARASLLQGMMGTSQPLFRRPTVSYNDERHPCAREKIHLLHQIQGFGTVLLVNDSGSVVQVGENAGEFLGIAPSVLVGMKFTEIFVLPEKKSISSVFEAKLVDASDGQRFMVSSHPYRGSWMLYDVMKSPDLRNSEHRTEDVVLTASQLALTHQGSMQELLAAMAKWVFETSGFDSVMVYLFDSNFCGTVIEEFCKDEKMSRFKNFRFPSSDIPAQARRLYIRNTVRQISDIYQENSNFFVTDIPVDLSDSLLRAVSQVHIKYMGNMGVRASFSISLVVNDNLFGMFVAHSFNTPMVLNFRQMESYRVIGQLCSLKLTTLISHSEAEAVLSIERCLSSAGTDSVYNVWNAAAEKLLELFNSDTVILFHKSKLQTDETLRTVSHQKGKVLDPLAVEEALRKLKLSFVSPIPSILLNSPNSSPNVSSPVPAFVGVDLGAFTARSDELFYSNSVFREFKTVLRNIYSTSDGTDAIRQSNMEYIPAGILFLSCSSYDLVFLRKEVVQEVMWAGRDCIRHDGSSKPLNPRSSFQAYLLKESGHSRPWTSEEITMARTLRFRLLQIANYELHSIQRDTALQVASQKSAFLAHMSHELRTPFNGIIGMLDVLMNSGLNESQCEYVSTAFESAQFMLRILDDVLLVSKMNANKLSLLEVQFDLQELVLGVERLMGVRAQQTENSLICECRLGSYSKVIGDPGRLRQIFLNLLSNSLKYTTRGEVAIVTKVVNSSRLLMEYIADFYRIYSCCNVNESVFRRQLLETTTNVSESPWFCFAVKDSGAGISGEVMGSLFAAFEQADTSSKRLYGGTGLGLHICKNLVKMMGGYIYAFSTVNVGSCFCFAIPLKLQSPTDSSAEQTLSDLSETLTTPRPKLTSDVAPPSKRAKLMTEDDQFETSTGEMLCSSRHSTPQPCMIPVSSLKSEEGPVCLIAEDNSINQRVLCKILEKLGISRFLLAGDGQEVLEQYKKNHDQVSCIFMDCHMPLMDGFEASKLIRTMEKSHGWTPVPIIAHTADVLLETDDRCRTFGINTTLIKPVTVAKVKEKLQILKLLPDPSGGVSPLL